MTFSYEKLDQPEVLALLFHPRNELLPISAGVVPVMIPVEDDISISGRFHLVEDLTAPAILFFHGNAETAADYDEIGPRYNQQGISFLAVEYRGYGGSGGTPTVSSMIRDAAAILTWTREWLAGQGHTGMLAVMGRSLGSVSAIELAAAHSDKIDGLIIESGIAQTMPLLLFLGIDAADLGISEMDGFKNLQKIATVSKPTYILHAQFDQFIPVQLAENLQAHCGAHAKEFQMIPGADHNNIIERTGRLYFEAIARFVKKLGKASRPRKKGVRG
jgi:alpha-beta hydrolase superfamily lysophospholipase